MVITYATRFVRVVQPLASKPVRLNSASRPDNYGKFVGFCSSEFPEYAMSLSPDDVKGIAHLARLAIDQEHIPAYVQNLSDILHFVERMNDVNTDDVEPMAHPADMVQRLRPDTVTESDQRERFQTIAPATADGVYLVPRVIE